MSTTKDVRKVSVAALEQGRLIAAAAVSGKHAAKKTAKLLDIKHPTARRIVEGHAPAWAIIEIIRYLRPETWAELLEEANEALGQKIGEAMNEPIQSSGAVSTRAYQILDSARSDIARSQEKLKESKG